MQRKVCFICLQAKAEFIMLPEGSRWAEVKAGNAEPRLHMLLELGVTGESDTEQVVYCTGEPAIPEMGDRNDQPQKD